MSDTITKPIVRSISIMDAIAIAGTTVLTRQVLGRFTGNNTLMSGLFKVGGALALDYTKFGGKIGNYVVAGLLIDGAKDFAGVILSSVGIPAKNNGSQQLQLI